MGKQKRSLVVVSRSSRLYKWDSRLLTAARYGRWLGATSLLNDIKWWLAAETVGIIQRGTCGYMFWGILEIATVRRWEPRVRHPEHQAVAWQLPFGECAWAYRVPAEGATPPHETRVCLHLLAENRHQRDSEAGDGQSGQPVFNERWPGVAVNECRSFIIGCFPADNLANHD